MKKFLAILLTAMMVLTLAACGNNETPVTPSADASYKTGLGITVGLTETEADEETPAKTQADVTFCEATFDQDGKIVEISIDVAQCKADYNADGTVSVADEVKTKRELGYDYNMKKFAPETVGEWFEQAAAFEAYCVGKTAAEVAAMPLGTNSHNYEGTPADADLMASCTIKVTDFIAALQKAYTNAANENTTYAVSGLGMIAKVTGTDAADEDPAASESDVTACAVALDADGKIVAISFDVAQCKADAAEGVPAFKAAASSSKKELGFDYNMKKFAPATVGEWFEQIAALEAYCIGKTPAEVLEMPLGTNSVGYDGTPADADLMSACTIKVTDFLAALANALGHMEIAQ